MTTTQPIPRSGASAQQQQQIVRPDILDYIIERQAQEMAARYSPVMDIGASIQRHKQLREYVEKAMIEGEDWGKVDGIPKPFLHQPGAQKLCVLFGYNQHPEIDREIEDWTGAHYGEPLFYYRMRCVLSRNGNPVGEGIGSASSWESKYRYRWLNKADVPMRYLAAIDSGDLQTRSGSIKEPAFAIEKAETTGKYGKPADYWAKWQAAIQFGEAPPIEITTKGGKVMAGYEMPCDVYRIPNPDFADVINTTQKMAFKRALVAATLNATGLGGVFTQDEDSGALEPEPHAFGRNQTKQTSNQAKPVQSSDPEELSAILAAFAAAKGGNIGKIIEEFTIEFQTKFGEVGRARVNSELGKFRALWPKDKPTPIKAYRELIRKLYEAKVELQAAKDLEISDSDIPQDWEAGRE